MPESESWIRRMVEQHDRDLYRGNGKPGITTRIQSLEDAVDGVDLSRLEARVMQTEQYIKDFKAGQSWIIRLLVGGIILAVLDLILHHH